MTALTAADVFRDYNTDGVPASGPYNVEKKPVRALLASYEARFSFNVKTYSTMADAQAATIGAADVVIVLGRSTIGDTIFNMTFVPVAPTTPAAWRFESADGLWFALANREVTPEMFGAKSDNSTDNTAAFVAMATWLRGFTSGLTSIDFSLGGRYKFWSQSLGAPTPYPLDLTGCAGLTINFNGAQINTDNLFSGGDAAVFKLSTGTSSITINNPWYVQTGKTTLSATSNGVLFQGEAVVAPWLNNIVINNWRQFGGRGGLLVQGAPLSSGVPLDNLVSGFEINNAQFDTVYYPLGFGWGGDNVSATIQCNNCGREYFPYNVSNHDVTIISDGGGQFNDLNIKLYAMPQLPTRKNITSKITVNYKNVGRINATTSQSLCSLELQQNPQGATLPTVTGAANNGSGLIRLTISSASAAAMATGQTWFVNSVGGVPNATGNWLVTVIDNTHVDLQASSFAGAYTSGGYMSVPGAVRDIEINYQVDDNGNGQPPALLTYKLDAAGAADTVARNYVVENIKVSGTLLNYNGGLPAIDIFRNDAIALGAWSGETIRNIIFRDLIVSGTSSSVLIDATNIASNLVLENVISASGVPWTVTDPSGVLRTINVSATGITDVSANGRALVRAANYAAMRTLLAAAPLSRSSNTVLALADNEALVLATSTFTQTLTAAATLGAGWRIWYRNAGTGIITLDPSGSETVDGLTTLKLYPGEECQISCDGTAFYTIGLSGRILLESKTLSAAATADFLRFDNNRFSRYEFQLVNVYPATNSDALWCRISNDGGSTFAASASDYFHSRVTGVTLTTVAADSKIVLCGTVDNTFARGAALLLDLLTPASGFANVISRGRFIDGATNEQILSAVGAGGTTVNGLRFLFSTGNISSGIIRQFGLR